MKAFFKNHLWIAIALIGSVILATQNNQNTELKKELPKLENNKIQLSARNLGNRSEKAPPAIGDLLEISHRTRDHGNFDPSSTLFAELSHLTAADLATLLSSPQLEGDDDDSLQLRKQLSKLHAVLDPLGALEKASDLNEQRTHFREVIRQSPGVAEEWLSRNDLGEAKASFEAEIMRARFLQAPASYLADWDSFDVFSETPLLSPSTFDQLARAINEPDNRDRRAGIITSLILSSVVQDPLKARERAEGLKLTFAELLPSFQEMTSYNLGSPEIVEWIISFPEESAKDYQSLLFGHFALRDLKGAAEWLNKVDPPPETKDLLLNRYAAIMSEVDPEEALNWAQKMASPTHRASTEERILISWKARSPQDAARWESSR